MFFLYVTNLLRNNVFFFFESTLTQRQDLIRLLREAESENTNGKKFLLTLPDSISPFDRTFDTSFF